MTTKRIHLPAYVLELNLGGTIYQTKRETDGRPYIDVPISLEHLVLEVAAHMGAANVPDAPVVDKPAADAGETDKKQSLEGVNTSTHSINAQDAIALAKGEVDLDTLKAMRDGEMLHPTYEGGRSSVLGGIALRIEELEKPVG